MGKEDQKSPLPMTSPQSLLLHPLLYFLSHPNIQNLLMMLPTSTGSGRKRVTLCPFQLSDLREIFKDLGSYTDAQTNTSKPLSL
jgi:hypothetical protein